MSHGQNCSRSIAPPTSFLTTLNHELNLHILLHHQLRLTKRKGTTDKEKGPAAPPPEESWKRLDAIALQWIYGIISMDLLQTVIKKNTRAYDAWIALENLFQDNKSSRSLYLQTKLTNTRLENFKDVAAYCQEVKILAYQLYNVDVPLSQTQLVLKVLGGLAEQYQTIATVIRSATPLLDFNATRSWLCQEEIEINSQALRAAQTAGPAL
ncbi:uncharacterized protein LOC143607891 [Bidens hawaiensis]|uniref:uncharacterized protein LOC143607891 n=1 Tax=Bidens hawaiensis TaxID=980011 RepID=UPI0040496EAD